MERMSTLMAACVVALMVSIGAPANAGETPSGQGRQGIAGYTVTYRHAAAGTRDDPVVTETRTGDPQAKWGGNGNGPPDIGDQRTRTWLDGPDSGVVISSMKSLIAGNISTHPSMGRRARVMDRKAGPKSPTSVVQPPSSTATSCCIRLAAASDHRPEPHVASVHEPGSRSGPSCPEIDSTCLASHALASAARMTGVLRIRRRVRRRRSAHRNARGQKILEIGSGSA